MKKQIYYMMFVLFAALSLIFAGAFVNTYAADSKQTAELKPKLDSITGKYGYIDKKGNWAVKPAFQTAKDFSEGLAVVTYSRADDFEALNTAYINSKGEQAFSAKFRRGNSFKGGYAAVTDKDEKVSIIDKKGKVVLKTDYYLYPFEPKAAEIHTLISDYPVGRNYTQIKTGCIGNNLKMIKPMFDGNPSYYNDDEGNEKILMGHFGAYGADGSLDGFSNYVITPGMDVVKLPAGFISGMSEGMLLLNCGGYFAYANKEGKVFDGIYVSKTNKIHKFTKAEPFSQGLAVIAVDGVLENRPGDETKTYGYIDKNGKAFKEPQYLSANSFKEGLAAVQPYPSSDYAKAILKLDGEYLKPLELRPRVVEDPKYAKFIGGSKYTQGEYDYVISEVKRIVKEIINDRMSEVQKVKAINKYVCEHANYRAVPFFDTTPMGLSYDFDAIGILKDGFGVCNAYVNLTGLLLTEAGIESHSVTGKAMGAPDNNHGWNLVKVDGKYYHLDTTWNDYDGPDKYFLVSDSYMKTKAAGERSWNTEYYPAAPSGYYNDAWQEK